MQPIRFSAFQFNGYPTNIRNQSGTVLGSKRADTYAAWLLLLGLAFIILVPFGGFAYLQTNVSRLSGVGPTVTPSAVTQAYCPGGSGGTAGLFPAGPGIAPPPGCSAQPQILSVPLSDFFANAALKASTYSCRIWVNTSPSSASYSVGPTGGIQVIGGTWFSPETVAAGAAPTTCTSGRPYTPGTQIVIQVCYD